MAMKVWQGCDDKWKCVVWYGNEGVTWLWWQMKVCRLVWQWRCDTAVMTNESVSSGMAMKVWHGCDDKWKCDVWYGNEGVTRLWWQMKVCRLVWQWRCDTAVMTNESVSSGMAMKVWQGCDDKWKCVVWYGNEGVTWLWWQMKVCRLVWQWRCDMAVMTNESVSSGMAMKVWHGCDNWMCFTRCDNECVMCNKCDVCVSTECFIWWHMWHVSHGCDKWTCFTRCGNEGDTFDKCHVAVTNESVSPGVAMKVTRPSPSLRLSTLTSLSTVTYFRRISHSPGQMYTALEWQTPAQYMWRHISLTHQARCTQP